ncbi:hypothetical protein ACSLN1_25765, partial [Escherichia coli]|uniref:hypothetical protein n=1 Tax=Escherichia coli TaxID=562 RepID=UPI003EE389FD
MSKVCSYDKVVNITLFWRKPFNVTFVHRNESGKKIWREDELPIIPEKWIINPREDAEKQLKTIRHLVER